ncbi:MAG: DUF3300 domain-containing protein [Actinomycetota bacterium]
MIPKTTRLRVPTQIARNLIALLCVVLILPWSSYPLAVTGQQQAAGGQNAALPPEQLDSLVAPVALYPDPLLAQTLVACTYPLEIVQLQQFIEQNKGLKDKALTDAVMKQDWDPSIQAMAAFPDTVKLLADNIRWTNDLGNAFLAQQDDVMNAVQRMRGKAVDKGALKTTSQQKVETKVVENKTVVVVESSSPEVVYVPSYDPVAVWGAPYYPYPPVAYPAYPAGGMLLSFGLGVAVGAAWGHGGWGWNCGWGGNNNININRNNNYINHYNNQRVNAGNRYGGNNNNWQHNPQHRGGAPYGNRDTAQRFGGTTRGDSMGQRQSAARQGSGGLRATQQPSGLGSRAGGSQFAGGARPSTQPSINRGPGGGGGDRIGNRQVSSGNMGSRNSSAFSGSSAGRNATRASSSRGASSMGSRGGGMSRGGGFRGGGGRRR